MPLFLSAMSRDWLRSSRFRMLTLAGVLALIACGRTPEKSTPINPGAEWHEFEGTWTAAGSRYILPMGESRQASLGNFSGSLVLAGPSRPAIGFRAEAIILSDSTTGMVGRAVWTDEHGDQAFSELRGEGTATNNKIVGTLVGGTGRYAGVTGTYEFAWRFLLENEDGTVQGQSIGLRGKVAQGSQKGTGDSGGARP